MNSVPLLAGVSEGAVAITSDGDSSPRAARRRQRKDGASGATGATQVLRDSDNADAESELIHGGMSSPAGGEARRGHDQSPLGRSKGSKGFSTKGREAKEAKQGKRGKGHEASLGEGGFDDKQKENSFASVAETTAQLACCRMPYCNPRQSICPGCQVTATLATVRVLLRHSYLHHATISLLVAEKLTRDLWYHPLFRKQ